MNPVQALFARLKSEGRTAFIPFVPAGDPDLIFTAELLPELAAAGADLIELGVPFSDPIADGPVIQASYTRALQAKFRLNDFFTTTRSLNPPLQSPLVAMASYSLIWKRGVTQFISEAQAAGLAGAVVPDLPIEEASGLSEICRQANFALTLLVTPTTQPDRAEKIVAACSGFVYVVSVVGITGHQAALPEAVAPMLHRLRNLTDQPLCVGFGVSQPEQVAFLKEHADGVIVGSALVKHLAGAGTPAGRQAARCAVVQLVRELQAPLR